MSNLRDLLKREAEKQKAYAAERERLQKDLLKREAEKQEAYAVKRERLQKEWIGALDRMMRQLDSWLREADSGGALTIESTTHRISERKIGTYEARGLEISLASRSLGCCLIRIRPIARYSIGCIAGEDFGNSLKDGHVEMTNYEKLYIFYRTLSDKGDKWVMVDDRDYRAQPLDREHFEAAVLGMLE